MADTPEDLKRTMEESKKEPKRHKYNTAIKPHIRRLEKDLQHIKASVFIIALFSLSSIFEESFFKDKNTPEQRAIEKQTLFQHEWNVSQDPSYEDNLPPVMTEEIDRLKKKYHIKDDEYDISTPQLEEAVPTLAQ